MASLLGLTVSPVEMDQCRGAPGGGTEGSCSAAAAPNDTSAERRLRLRVATFTLAPADGSDGGERRLRGAVHLRLVARHVEAPERAEGHDVDQPHFVGLLRPVGRQDDISPPLPLQEAEALALL